MSLHRLIYLSRIEIPNQRSHSIQMMHTCHAIAKAGVPVDFFIRGKSPVDQDAAFEYYGLAPLDNFTLRTLRPREWEHAAFVRRIMAIARRCGSGTALYTRDYHLARRLIRLRVLLRLPVFIESHMLDGFFDREYVPQWVAEVSAGRVPDPRATEWFNLNDFCYRRADGVVSLLASTGRVLNEQYPGTPVVEAWHGTDPDSEPSYEPDGRDGVYYIGNLYDYYHAETLVEAMPLLPGREVFIVGGNDAGDLARTRQSAVEAGVAERVHFLGHVPPTQVHEFYRRCRVVVTLFAGPSISHVGCRWSRPICRSSRRFFARARRASTSSRAARSRWPGPCSACWRRPASPALSPTLPTARPSSTPGPNAPGGSPGSSATACRAGRVRHAPPRRPRPGASGSAGAGGEGRCGACYTCPASTCRTRTRTRSR